MKAPRLVKQLANHTIMLIKLFVVCALSACALAQEQTLFNKAAGKRYVIDASEVIYFTDACNYQEL